MSVLLSPLWWLVQLVVGLVLGYLVGVPVVAWLAYTRAWGLRPSPWSQVAGALLWEFAPRWAYLWSNEELGIYIGAGQPTFREVFYWAGWRNKVSNLRLIRPFYVRVDPARVRSIGNCRNIYVATDRYGETLWSFAWQGLYSGLWIRWPTFSFRIGFTLVPADADGYDPVNFRQSHCPFSLELKRN